MVMHKLIISSILILNMLFLSSCSLGGSRIKMLSWSNDEERANFLMEKVLEAVKDNDKDAIKSLFSENALSDADNFDDSIDDLFDFLQGEVESWEKLVGSGVFESIHYGSKKKEVSSYYHVNTDQQKYYFLLDDCPIDTDQPDNVGLYLLLVVKVEDRDKIYDNEQKILFDGDKKISRAGIYIPFK